MGAKEIYIEVTLHNMLVASRYETNITTHNVTPEVWDYEDDWMERWRVFIDKRFGFEVEVRMNGEERDYSYMDMHDVEPGYEPLTEQEAMKRMNEPIKLRTL